MALKILILITKGEVGGAQQSVFNLASGLHARGVAVEVGFDGGDFLKNKLEQTRIPYYQFVNLKRSANPFKNIQFIFELKKFLKDQTKPFDIVYCNSSNTLFGAIAARYSTPRPKVVFTFRGLSLLDNKYLFAPVRWFYRAVFAVLLKFVDAQVFVSNSNQQAAKELGISKNDTVVYNAVIASQESWTSSVARNRLAEMCGQNFSESFVIGSIGRLAYQKNYAFLINATIELRKIIPNLKVIIIGAGPEEENLKNQVKELKLENTVFLPGAIADASKYMPAFDMFVLPSRFEGMSITLIEALKASSVIVTTDIEANKETVGAGGAFFPLNDATKFLELVERLYKNPNERATLAAKAQEQARKFDINYTVTKYSELFSTLCAESRVK